MPNGVVTTLSLHEVAQQLKVHYMTAYRYVRSGRLPARQVNGEWQVLVADVRIFVESRKNSGRKSTAKRAKRGQRPAADWAGRFEVCLLAGDELGAEQVLNDALTSGHDLFSLYLEVVSPALVGIGARWANGNLHIHEEHRASTIVARLFARVSVRFAHRGPSRGTIVIGGPNGEHHGLPLTMVADLLRVSGWNVSDIGPDNPPESFAAAAASADQLRAVCVGVTRSESLPAAQSVIAAIRNVVGDVATIYAGGAAVGSLASAEQLGADAWANNPRSLIAQLSGAPRE